MQVSSKTMHPSGNARSALLQMHSIGDGVPSQIQWNIPGRNS